MMETIARLKYGYLFISLIFMAIVSFNAHAQETTLYKVVPDDEDLLLLNVKLDNKTLVSSVDAYLSHGKLLLAIEPVFDALGLRYRITEKQITLWKEEQKNSLRLSSEKSPANTGELARNAALWADDGSYLLVDSETLSRIFDSKFSYNLYQLVIDIATDEYKFPLQKLQTLEKKRQQNRIYAKKTLTHGEPDPVAFTIADQYRLFTLPHGQIIASTARSNDNTSNNITMQLTSDFLYHSASLTLNKSNKEDTAARFLMSRYKTAPNKPVLGLFDSYSFGDISGFSRSLVSATNSGVGIRFNRAARNFRHQNQRITLTKSAFPGWEVELYHNNRYILSTVVPKDGQLILADLETEYGINYFQIKLYGPYGEEKILEEHIDLRKNALAKNDTAFSFYALDSRHQVIDDKNNDGYKLTDAGATFDIGITDNWQFGLGYAVSDSQDSLLSEPDYRQKITLKNQLSFPGMLLENDLAYDESQSGYASLTTLMGNAFAKSLYSFSYLHASDYASGSVNAKNQDWDLYDIGFSGGIGRLSYGFNGNYHDRDGTKTASLSNRLSRSFNRLYVNHVLKYTSYLSNKQQAIDTSSWIGTLGLGGPLGKNLRVSGDIIYNPEADEIIQKSSSIGLRWRQRNFLGADHYIGLRYRPLVDSGSEWLLNHNAAWSNRNFQLTLSTSYDDLDRWSLQAGVRFFLAYDYHNNRPILRSDLSTQTATINAHTYLDRQLNGHPDPLDYNLPGVTFRGNPAWEGLESGDDGRTLLPGVSPGDGFKFSANWQAGSATINNDYVVYTHPGAYIEANIPFYLSSEFSGFVLRQRGEDANPLGSVPIQLLDQNNTLIAEKLTDIDGYYEFLNMPPGQYRLRVAANYLRERAYTADIVGYKLPLMREGGFIELDAMLLNRVEKEGVFGKEALTQVEYTKHNHEPIVWNEDKKVRRNYFVFPTKDKITAPHSLEQSIADKPVKATAAKVVSKPAAEKKPGRNPPVKKALEAAMVSNKKSLPPNHVLPQISIKPARESVKDDVALINSLTATQAGYQMPETPPAAALKSWVIQLYAGVGKPDPKKIKSFSAIGDLYLATKTRPGSGSLLYCLISHGFTEKYAAQAWLKRSGLKGWVTEARHYRDIEAWP